MAGRGRPTTSLTHEQMASLGLMGKDMSQAITAPPPIFPALMSKPVQLEVRYFRIWKFSSLMLGIQTGAARDYKILWKEDFISFLKDSSYFSDPISENDGKIQRYSDKYVVSSLNYNFNCNHIKIETFEISASTDHQTWQIQQRFCLEAAPCRAASQLETKSYDWKQQYVIWRRKKSWFGKTYKSGWKTKGSRGQGAGHQVQGCCWWCGKRQSGQRGRRWGINSVELFILYNFK